MRGATAVMQRVVHALLRKAATGRAGRAPSPVGIGRTDKKRLTRALGLPAKELEAEISAYRLDQIESLFADDPWAMNVLRNHWEFAAGASVLRSYPIDICLPIADLCNARCTFCTSWLEGRKILSIEEIDRFEALFRHARRIGLAGHGEPLSHPRIEAILGRLAAWLDVRAACYVITNGVHLGKLIDRLIAGRVMSYAVSLNAATPQTHAEIMGIDHFEEIIDAIGQLVADRNQGRIFGVSISLVVTRQNLSEIPDFIELGNSLDVSKIQIKTLAGANGVIPGLNYHTLPPFLHPDYARLKREAAAAIAGSRVAVDVDLASWDTNVFHQSVREDFERSPPATLTREQALADPVVRSYWQSQEKFHRPTWGRLLQQADDFDGINPYGRSPRYSCRAPYQYLYINDFSYTMVPCCYLNSVPGFERVVYDGSGDFFDAWNSPAMIEIRQRLNRGPLFNMCTKCPGVY
jgi:pyruvate-formate lyase-activating enzyme